MTPSTESIKKKTRRLSVQNEKKLFVSEPQIEDVLLGRGPAKAKHNEFTTWKKLIYENRPKYTDPTCKRSSKKDISLKIVEEVKGLNGRFLEQRSDGEWDIVSDKLALTKTKQALRDGSRADGKESMDVENAKHMYMDMCTDIWKKTSSVAQSDQDISGEYKMFENMIPDHVADDFVVENGWTDTQSHCLMLAHKENSMFDSKEENFLRPSSLSNSGILARDYSAAKNTDTISFSKYPCKGVNEQKETAEAPIDNPFSLRYEQNEEGSALASYMMLDANTQKGIETKTPTLVETIIQELPDKSLKRKETTNNTEARKKSQQNSWEGRNYDECQIQTHQLNLDTNVVKRAKNTTLELLLGMNGTVASPITDEEFALCKTFHSNVLALANLTSKLRQKQQALKSAIETMDTDLQHVALSQNTTALHFKRFQSSCADQACENIAMEMKIEELEQNGGTFSDCLSLAQYPV